MLIGTDLEELNSLLTSNELFQAGTLRTNGRYVDKKFSMANHRSLENKSLICCVPQCKNYFKLGLPFHLFPKDVKMRQRWVHTLKIGKAVSDYMKVCGEHFQKNDYFLPGMYLSYLGVSCQF